jgi:MFS family permease
MFRIGIAVFTVASILGGFATNETWLIAARVLQGIGGAIAAPTALSLIAVNFAKGSQRNRAMGVYAAMAGLGSTDWPLCLSAHWCSAKAAATAADSTSPGQ